MLFDVTEICRPEERRAVVAEHVVDVRPALTAWHRRSLHPRRRVFGRVFVKMLAGNAVRVALQRQRPVAQMRDNRLSDLRVERDNLTLRIAALRIENLVEIGDGQFPSFDFDLLFLRHLTKQRPAG